MLAYTGFLFHNLHITIPGYLSVPLGIKVDESNHGLGSHSVGAC